jgi:potassium efflux system protein
MENYLPVWHAMNCAIDETFRKAHVEIAFPQRDLHVRSVDAKVLFAQANLGKRPPGAPAPDGGTVPMP